MRSAILFLFTAASLSGCAPLYKDYSVGALQPDAASSYGKLMAALTRPRPGAVVLILPQCFAAPVAQTDETTCSAQRNQMVASLVIASDEMCMAHRRSMYGSEAAANITFGTMTSFFAGAASVVNPEQLRSVLAALALFSNSERSLINETIYKQMLVTAVDKKIVEMRDTRQQQIYASLTLETGKYPAVVALNDVVRMHSACSFIDGLQKALDEGTQGAAAQKISRLRETLRALNAEQASLTGTETPDRITNLKDRSKAVSDALKAEESR